MKLTTALACAAAAAVLLCAAEARANSYTFCASMETAYSDSGIGEDYLVSDVYAARYLKVRVKRGSTTVVPTTYTNTSGCVSFSDSHKGQFVVEYWGELRVPRSDNGSYTNKAYIYNSAGNLPKWTYYWTFGGTTGQKTFTFNQTRRTNLINVTRWALERFSDGLINKTFIVWDKGGCAEPENSCNGTYSGTTSTVFINPTTGNSEKFLIAHEIGHSVVAHWFGYHPGFGTMYNVNDGGSACEWTGYHALHSKEYSSAALAEGFAQYYATYLFNSASTSAWFRYYKQEYKSGTVTTVNMENGPTGGSTAYLDNVCTGTKAGRGVELDWARQLWDYRTNSGSKPSNYAILRQIKNGLTSGSWSNTNTWARVSAGVQEYDSDYGTSFHSRWTDFGEYNGIDH